MLPFLKAGRTGYHSEVRGPGLGGEADRTQSGKRFASKKAQIVFSALVPEPKVSVNLSSCFPHKRRHAGRPVLLRLSALEALLAAGDTCGTDVAGPSQRHPLLQRRTWGKGVTTKPAGPDAKHSRQQRGREQPSVSGQDATPVSLHHRSRRGHRWPERPCPDVHRAM